MRQVLAIVVVMLTLVAQRASAEVKGLSDPGKLQTLKIETGRAQDGVFRLAGRDAYQQLVVMGQFATGQLRDLTRQVRYQAMPDGVVAIDASGMVTPLKEGQAAITITAADGPSTSIKVIVSNIVEDVPVNFSNQVVPIFTKFGCNAGGCHGKSGGQNGFKLSLLGFEPPEDYEYLVKEARGRRIFPAAPAHSLLLLKAVGAVPHGGGKKLDVDSPFYKVLLRWVEQGTPFGKKTDPTVKRIEVLPKERVMERKTEQQLVVVAHLSDGTTVDITRMTQFESNHGEMAAVSDSGLVSTQELAGSVAIMTRFQTHVDVFRATVPLGAPVANLPPAKNFIDEHVFKKLKELGMPPSALADDATFLRRVTIDIAGRLPKQQEVEAFLADQAADKYEQLVDRLLASPEYSDYFANKWSAVLRNRRKAAADDPAPTFAFHKWIKESLEQNKPYDQFVRDVLTATGAAVENPPVIWYREVKERDAQLEDVAQLFLGQRIQCARCHHHPFEKWSQDDYYGLAAFFSQIVVKDPPPPKAKKKGEPLPPREPVTVTHQEGVAKAVNIKNNQALRPTGLGGQPFDIPADADPRGKLADWMVQADNPFFARTLVNRYWKHFFSRGLVDPEDDIRVTNPPSHPELLDALAKAFVDSRYDLKKLIRLICTSQVYRLSAVPNEHNADDRQNYSRFLPKRLNAEVLLDAIDDVTGGSTVYKGVPPGTRAVQLPDNQFDSYFLSVFGRPDSSSACECERSGDATLAQSLHMMNSAEILNKVKAGRAPALAKDKQRPDADKIREIYLVALGRQPTKEETDVLVAFIQKKNGAAEAYEDVVWALINTKEFQFNH